MESPALLSGGDVKFNWEVKREADTLVKLVSNNLTKLVELTWDKAGYIICNVDNTNVLQSCEIEELCIKLTDYLLQEMVIK